MIFWLKNRRPSEWRDVHLVDGAVGHYIISDRPMTEAEWIAERTKVIDATPVLPQSEGIAGKPKPINSLGDEGNE